MGRAFPEAQMMSYAIAGVKPTPALAMDYAGNTASFETSDTTTYEHHIRAYAAAAGGMCDVVTTGPVCVAGGKKVLTADAAPRSLLSHLTFDDASGPSASWLAGELQSMWILAIRCALLSRTDPLLSSRTVADLTPDPPRSNTAAQRKRHAVQQGWVLGGGIGYRKNLYVKPLCKTSTKNYYEKLLRKTSM